MIPLRVLDSPEALAEAAARTICEEISALIRERGRVSIAIAGGFVAQRLLPRFREHGVGVEWSGVDVFWADERFVPAGHPHRNDAEAMRAFFDESGAAALHPMPADEGQPIADAAAAAESEWRRATGGIPFDLVILGMGPDGHVASLFPGRRLPKGSAIIAVEDSPKPPERRLSFSLPILRASARIHLLAAGAAKAGALSTAIAQATAPGGADDSSLPAARILSDRALVWTDREGAALLG